VGLEYGLVFQVLDSRNVKSKLDSIELLAKFLSIMTATILNVLTPSSLPSVLLLCVLLWRHITPPAAATFYTSSFSEIHWLKRSVC
jgi:hypothetical protein